MACRGCAKTRQQIARRLTVTEQRRAGLALPADAVPHLAEGVKAWRAALLILEPWLAQQQAGQATSNLRRDIGSMKGFVGYVERQVIAHEGA